MIPKELSYLIIYLIMGLICMTQACNTQRTVVLSDDQDMGGLPESIKTVQIDSSIMGAGACEPTICIDPTNIDHIVAGSILDRVYVSKDGGRSWSKDMLTSPYGVYGDPVIRADKDGNFYYSHLASPGTPWQDESFLDRIVVQKSTDGGLSWNEGSYTPPAGVKDQDKQWLGIDPDNNTILMSWTEFDKYNSADSTDRSRILFSKSSDQAETWSEPIAINQYEGNCLDGDQTTEGAVPAAGTDGTYYVTWAYDEKIYFDYSKDRGETWQQQDIIVADQPGGWEYDIPGLSRCNGMPILKVDHSNGPNRGTLYINWSDQRNGVDDTDIWLTKSTDGGLSWSSPIRVNDDLAGKHQFFCGMDVDTSDGKIYVVFYDRRAHDDNRTDVYIAMSDNAGQSWINKKINSKTFTPSEVTFFGDYTDISAVDGHIRPIWTQQEGFKLSVWTALIDMK